MFYNRNQDDVLLLVLLAGGSALGVIGFAALMGKF